MKEAPEQYDLPGKVIGFAMKIHSALGAGFLESVYQNALSLELRRAGLKVEAEKPISVRYEGELIGAFVADLLVNDVLIIETKAVLMLARIHEVQLVNYLVATGIDEGLLLNFGSERLEFKKKFRHPKPKAVSL
ncbi:MAG TPA: GxxExxY protein [Chthoniobacterales bacterium]|nr:GxxExxY protein [Chthoniobacterales bacterium]